MKDVQVSSFFWNMGRSGNTGPKFLLGNNWLEPKGGCPFKGNMYSTPNKPAATLQAFESVTLAFGYLGFKDTYSHFHLCTHVNLFLGLCYGIMIFK